MKAKLNYVIELHRLVKLHKAVLNMVTDILKLLDFFMLKDCNQEKQDTEGIL